MGQMCASHGARGALEAGLAGGSYGFSLCHGDAGNAEFPLLRRGGAGRAGAGAHRRAGRPDGDRALRGAGAPLALRVPNGGETPGLMPGLAGIGHFCLRLYDPAGVPGVLLVTPDQPAVRLAPGDAVPGPRPAAAAASAHAAHFAPPRVRARGRTQR